MARTNKLQVPNIAVIVDGDQTLRKLIRNYLQALGVSTVHDFDNGTAALSYLTSNACDLMVVDWKMKSPDCPSFLTSVRTLPAHKELSIVLMSGTYTKDDITKAQSFGQLKFLVKPFAEEVFYALFDVKIEKKKDNKISISSNGAKKESLDLQIVKGEVGKVELHHDKNKVAKGGGLITQEGTSSQGFTATQESNNKLGGYDRMKGDQANSGEFDFKQEKVKAPPTGGDIKVGRPEDKGWDIKQERSQPQGRSFDLATSRSQASAGDLREQGKKAGSTADLREKGPHARHGSDLNADLDDPLLGDGAVEEESLERRGSFSAALSSSDLAGLEESLGDDGLSAMALDLDEHGQSEDDAEDAKSPGVVVLDLKSIAPRRTKAEINAIPRKTALTQRILGENHDIPAPKAALIIASDVSWGEVVSQYLEQVGTPIRDVIEDCDRAWGLSQTDYYDIIMLDWDTKGLSALCYYNRVRSRSESADVPIIVMSGQVNRQEFRILGESSFTRVMEKPVQFGEFQRVLNKSLVTSFAHKFVAEQVTKVLGTPGGEQQAVKMLRRASKDVPDAFSFLVVAGKYFNAANRTDMAESFFKMALERDPHSLTALVELSRIYHTTKRSDKAIELLGRAYQLAPESVERLCLMGEIGLTLKQTDDAKKYFEKALSIDSESKKGKAGLELVDHLGGYLKEHSTDTASWQSLASMLNTIGVSMVRGANYTKGFEHYEAASVFIKEPDVLARLHFNLGIGFLRYGDLEKGIHWLKSACERMPGGYPKAQMFLKAAQKELNKKLKAEGA